MQKLHSRFTRRILLVSLCLTLTILALGWGTARLFGAFGTVTAQGQKSPQTIGNFDVRVNGTAQLEEVLSKRLASESPASRDARIARTRVQAQSLGRGIAQLRAIAPDVEVKLAPGTGGVEMVSSWKGLSAAAQGQSGQQIVLAFLHNNKAAYGLTDAEIDALRFIGESISPSGLRMVRMEQLVNSRPVFQSETRFIIDKEARIVRSLGLLVPRVSDTPLPKLTDIISASEALKRALAPVGIAIDPSAAQVVNSTEGGYKVEVVANNSAVTGNVPSQVVYFSVAPGVIVPAWSQIIFTNGDGDYYSLVDATTGALLWRKNIRDNASTQQARFSVYVQADGKTPADSPAPQSPTTVAPGSGTQFPEIARTIVSMLSVQNLTASPNGWIADGGTTTTGNNVDAYLDRVGGAGETNVPDIGALDNNGRPIGNPDMFSLNRDFLGNLVRDFNYTPAPSGGNPNAGDDPTGNTAVQNAFRRGAVTQLFYVANWYHDRLFALGFDEAAGNFQFTNFSGMGAGNDRVLAEAQDSSSTNNANFSTPPDGSSGRMQMFRFIGPTPDRDGDLDTEVVIHELTHGLSNRLIGNAAGLVWDPGRGMGEGWSDFYSLSLLNNTNADDPNASYATGAYATYQFLGLTDNYLYGIRRFPYSTDNTVNPLTWADVDATSINMSGGLPVSPVPFNNGGAFEVHNVGEIWALSLWEVRSRVIAAHGGDVPTGNQIMLQIVTDALKMTPSNPSFTDARDALIAADCATNACANETAIWAGFADRGLGYKATAPLGVAGVSRVGVGGHEGVGESFSVPYLDVQSTSISDSFGNNNGAIDPGEPIKLTVKLTNPWRQAARGVASAAATLTTSTPGVVIFDANSAYGAIPAQGNADGDTFLFTVPTNATCGQSLKFSLQTTSALGSATVNFTLRVGLAGGTGAPITFTKASIGLAIPDGNRLGVTDTFTISDDVEIADLNFRLDSLTHTWSGDLVIMLRAPNGYGTDMIVRRGVFFGVPNSDGDNFINTVIDDQAGNDAAHDLNQTTPAQAPYTGSWLPAYNSPIWSLFGISGFNPDPVGQLSRLNGQSTQGDWKVNIADYATPDSGTLNSWSLIVTPRAFTCAAFSPVAAVTGTKSTSSTFTLGASVSYTVVLTNNGSAVQGDNAGHEFTDTLPSQLTLVNAMATSGTVSTAGNTVNWDGLLAPAGGSVTITINATVNTNASSQTVSNQGTISYDNDNNGTNNATAVTDDPSTAAPNDPTTRQIPCTITCPTNQVTWTAGTTAAVNYPAPTTTGTCGTVPCSPASGSTFNVGTTTVTCTAQVGPNCSFTVTVNRLNLGASLGDPLACAGPGNKVNGSFSATNTTGSSATVSVTAALSNVLALPGMASADQAGTLTVLSNSINWTGTLGAGQTVTVSWMGQLADNLPIGAQACSTITATANSLPVTGQASACVTINCPAVGPGLPFPAAGSEVSDQKAGSVLYYNLYSSSIAAPNAQNTRINITNTHMSLAIAVHLFFVDGATCSIADSLVCLTPNQTASFQASDIDPGTTGYLVAVASDLITGCPVNFNYLIGDEYVKLSSGHAANLAAEAFAAIAGGLTACTPFSVTAQLNFDGVSYNRAPRVLAASNIPSRADGNDTLIVLNRVGGSLAAGAGTLGSIFGILYDDTENPLSFTFTAGTCQFRSSLSNSFPRVAPRFEQFIPAGRSGWAKFYSLADIGLLGAQLNFNANAGTAANAFNQGHNLHKLTLTTAATLTIPIFPPNC